MSPVTMQSPFPRRLLAWFNERFPFEHGILFFTLYATAVLVGRYATSAGALDVGVKELLGFLPVWCFFLMLRVFDEHKDFESDCHNYPERVLQSGKISLGHLKVVGALAIVTQLVGSILLDGGFGAVTIWWLGVFAYSLLMAREFFVGEWLSKRLVLYATSHMLVMTLAMLWMAQIGAGSAALPWQAGLLGGLAFLCGGAFEVARKIRAPEEERDEVDSYTKSFGTGGAPIVVGGLLTVSIVVLGGLVVWITDGTPSPAWFAVLMAILVVPLITLQKFRRHPTPKGRKVNEGLVSMAMLASYLVVIAAIVTTRGIGWG
ncbi:MAG: prenyltransferase [Bradymonadaceae bacterium]